MRDYAAMTTLVVQKLQSAGTVDFSVSEVDNQIEECLKEFSHFKPHVHPVIFKIESRFGTASTTSANNLVDSTKGQFLSTDPDNEKVVHNTTDHTWAVVLSYADTTSIGLSRDIFAVNENYRIYNKRCWNKKQVYIGDMADWEDIESVEYPIGEKRNWRIYDNEILEIDSDYIDDSDASSIKAGMTLPNVDVLVRFKRPHILSQLTDWAGKLAGTAAIGSTTISASSLQAAGTIEVGEELYIENHKTLYVVTAATTIASNTTAITIYPGLESAIAATTWTFTFTKSSLRPNDEEIFADLVAARLAVNKAPKFFNTIAIGNPNAWRNFYEWGQGRLSQTLNKLSNSVPPKYKRRYTTE